MFWMRLFEKFQLFRLLIIEEEKQYQTQPKMYNPEQLIIMLANESATTELKNEPKNVVEAYLLCFKIQNRITFSEYCSKNNYRSLSTKIEQYMNDIGCPAISATSAQRIKTVLLKDVHRNYHTEALLGGAAQAYFDLCLFMGVTGICQQTNELEYIVAIQSIKESLKALKSGYERVCNLLSCMVFGQELKDYETISTGVICFAELEKRFQQTIDIVNLFNEDKIGYEKTYDSIIEIVKEVVQQSEDEVFFSHVVTVLRNKDSFTDDQISHVNEVYTNRFTDEQKEAQKLNIPVETPDVSSTQAFFFKSKEQKNELADLV